MGLKKLGVALLAVVVLGAIAANSAFAANEYSETGGAWYTGASPGTKLTGSKGVTTTAVGTQTLKTTVAGTPLKLSATGINCASCTIENSGTSAKAAGALEFTGVTVSEPAGCTTTSTITTKALSAVLGMNTAKTLATIKFTPAEGATFATVVLSGTECPISGTYKVTGTQFAKAANATGVFAKEQALSTSAAIQESAGTATSLKFGENAAILTGELKAKLAGEPEWAGKES